MLAGTLHLLQTRFSFFANLLWEHLQISLLAACIGAILGLLIGILISEYQRCARFVTSFVNLVYTIPAIALLGFLIPFSGIGNATAVIALTIYALLPMAANTHAGLSNIDPQIMEAARGMGSGRWQLLTKIKLPLAMPTIIAGARSMVVMTIALAGIASFVGAGGLGVAIYRGITTNHKEMTLAGSLLIAILAILADFLLALLEKKAQKRAKGER